MLYVIITDQGSEFKGLGFAQWLAGMGIEHRRTTPYHLQSNGRAERFNRTLKRILKKLVNGERADWEDRLSAAVTAYHICTLTVTGHSPFMLRYAHPPRYPLTGLLAADDPSRTFKNRVELQADLMAAAAKATEDSRVYNKRRLERQANASVLNVGDTVILKAREPLSLTAQWDYRFLVTKINGKVVTIVQPVTGVLKVVNREHLRVVNPDIAWERVHSRPRRTQVRARGYHPVIHYDNEKAVPADQHAPPTPRNVRARSRLLHREDRVTAQLPPNLPLPRLWLKRQNEGDDTPGTSYNLRKRPRWTAEEIALVQEYLTWLLR